MIKTIMILIALSLIALAYVVWLDYGCDVVGVITLQGKECIN